MSLSATASQPLVHDTGSLEQPLPRDIRKTGLCPDFWYPVARSGDVKTAKPHGVSFAGDPIVLVRTEKGELFALEDRCAHRQVPLRYGVVRGELLQCGYHCWTYNKSGKCVAVPYLPEGASRPDGVRSYPCREAYGLVFVFPGDPARAESTPFPDISAFHDRNYRTRYLDRRVECHYSFMFENLADMNHQFLHRKLMGWIRATCLDYSQGDGWSEVKYTFSRVGGKQSLGERFIIGKSDPARKKNRNVMAIRTEYPYQTLKFWPGGRKEPALDLWNCYIPVDREQRVNHTYGLMMVKKPGKPGLAHLLWPAIVWFSEQIFAEDRWIVELEQAAFDQQGEDRNQEIFPPIQSLRRVLVSNGVDIACEHQ